MVATAAEMRPGEPVTIGGPLPNYSVYVAGEDIRYLEGLDTPVGEGGEVQILPAVAGG